MTTESLQPKVGRWVGVYGSQGQMWACCTQSQVMLNSDRDDEVCRHGCGASRPSQAAALVAVREQRQRLCERWLRDTMKHRPPPPKGTRIDPTPQQIRCAELIECFMGLHHAPDTVHSCTDSGIEIVFHRGYTLSTFDFSEMTRLTLLAHDMHIRVQVHTRGMALAMMLHTRTRDGEVSFRHPTIESVLAAHREKFPEGWSE